MASTQDVITLPLNEWVGSGKNKIFVPKLNLIIRAPDLRQGTFFIDDREPSLADVGDTFGDLVLWTIGTWSRVYHAILDRTFAMPTLQGKVWPSACEYYGVYPSDYDPYVSVWNHDYDNSSFTITSRSDGSEILAITAAVYDKLQVLKDNPKSFAIDVLNYPPMISFGNAANIPAQSPASQTPTTQTTSQQQKPIYVREVEQGALPGSLDLKIRTDKKTGKVTYQPTAIATKEYKWNIHVDKEAYILYPLTGYFNIKTWKDDNNNPTGTDLSIGLANDLGYFNIRMRPDWTLDNGTEISSDWHKALDDLRLWDSEAKRPTPQIQDGYSGRIEGADYVCVRLQPPTDKGGIFHKYGGFYKDMREAQDHPEQSQQSQDYDDINDIPF